MVFGLAHRRKHHQNKKRENGGCRGAKETANPGKHNQITIESPEKGEVGRTGSGKGGAWDNERLKIKQLHLHYFN